MTMRRRQILGQAWPREYNSCCELNFSSEAVVINKFGSIVLGLVTIFALAYCAKTPNAHLRGASQKDAIVLVGAGDIADCRDLSGAEATAKLLDEIPGTVMAVGDLAYPDGTKENFACYDRTWGRQKARTRPAPGNHEFHSSAATPYFDYFGAVAGAP